MRYRVPLLVVLIAVLLLVLSACQSPIKVAICANNICEFNEENTCPEDCIPGNPISDTTGSDLLNDLNNDLNGGSGGDSGSPTDTSGLSGGSGGDSGSPVEYTSGSGSGSEPNDNRFGHEFRNPNDFEYVSTYPGTQGGTTGTSGGNGYTNRTNGTATTNVSCVHNWQCTSWSVCGTEGKQTRTCKYTGTCSVQPASPLLTQSCIYLGTCFDRVKNQDEENVDCGGVCQSCYVAPIASCYDGFQNQGERGVDCGGPCTVMCPEKITTPVVTKKPLSKTTLSLIGALLFLLFLLGVLLYWKRKEVKSFLEKHGIKVKGLPAVPGVPQTPSSYGTMQSPQYRSPYQRQNYSDLYNQRAQSSTGIMQRK